MRWISLDFLWKIAPQLWSNVQGKMMQLNCHMGDGTTTVTWLGHNRDTKVPSVLQGMPTIEHAQRRVLSLDWRPVCSVSVIVDECKKLGRLARDGA